MPAPNALILPGNGNINTILAVSRYTLVASKLDTISSDGQHQRSLQWYIGVETSSGDKQLYTLDPLNETHTRFGVAQWSYEAIRLMNGVHFTVIVERCERGVMLFENQVLRPPCSLAQWLYQACAVTSRVVDNKTWAKETLEKALGKGWIGREDKERKKAHIDRAFVHLEMKARGAA